MKLKILFPTLFIALIVAVSCQKEAIQNNTQIDNQVLSVVDDEVLADIDMAEFLDEGDDGIFWGDELFSQLKSATVHKNPCATVNVEKEGNKRTVTLNFSEGDCGKSGVIIIEYLRPEKRDGFLKKRITYVDFTNKNGVVYNGTKDIVRKKGDYKINSDITREKVTEDGKTVTFIRKGERHIEWICGLEKKDRTDNIKKVTGHSKVTKLIDGEEVKSYNRKIVEPLLIVKACDLKIQAGVVKVIRRSGEEIIINYGDTPAEINCESEFECGNTIEVTKGDETVTVTYENGKRVKNERENGDK